ncbi:MULTISPECIES: nickel/cobalt transporter [unclassified Thalassospira]|uniref:nickel/cobalt transporter n=1 Tax=unclassified Thalassospira TaxID=2648997 RepID=UPI0025D8C06C|nr:MULTISPECIES: high frequency lysogenization protein HflD [unclassified Thalassospira]|tara:strand:+ start:4283 stop:5317 length:1035 start_codon:yes stop_codon:yes gene_type:complete
MAAVLAALLLAISFSSSNLAFAQSSNLLGRGAVDSSESPPSPTPEPAEESLITLPDWLSGIIGQTVILQTKLNREITSTLREAKNGDSFWPGMVIIALSFAYGVFHAAGPGHGKMITTTYFLSRDAGWRQGVAMGSLIAAVQAVSAIVMVGGLTLILNLGPAAVTRNGLILEAVSYALIAALGALMALRILQGRDDCCDHHGPGMHHHDHAHHHDHHHSVSGHHNHGHDSFAATQSSWQMISTGIVAGLRPCTGSILVLLFTLANGMFLIGVGAAFAMALGVAITISLIGLAAIGIRTGTQHLFSLSETSSGIIRRTVGFAGAAIITLFGVMLLLASARQLGWL